MNVGWVGMEAYYSVEHIGNMMVTMKMVMMVMSIFAFIKQCNLCR